MNFPKETIYISSFSKLPSGIPSESVYKSLDIAVIVNTQTGVITNTSITLFTDLACDFLKSLIVGFNIKDDDIDILLEEIRLRYHGSAQKAIIVAIKKIAEKYMILNEDPK